MKPIPIPLLIASVRISGLALTNSDTAAGSPDQKAMQPAKTVADASSPFTTAVANEGLVSQRMRMTAAIRTANRALGMELSLGAPILTRCSPAYCKPN
jgi:hypothetical protein